MIEVSQDNNVGGRTSSIILSIIQAKGFNKTINVKKSRRSKSWVELQLKRRKLNIESRYTYFLLLILRETNYLY